MLNYAVIFATGVIRVLVGALADDSAEVREAASSALQENARWYAFVSFFFLIFFVIFMVFTHPKWCPIEHETILIGWTVRSMWFISYIKGIFSSSSSVFLFAWDFIHSK